MRAKLLIIVVLAGILGYGAYRYWSKSPAPSAPPTVETQPELDSAPPVTLVERKTSRGTNVAATKAATSKTNMPGTVGTPESSEWKTKLETILGGNFNPEQKQRQIKELLASLPDVEAEQAVQALTLSVKNEAYGFIKPLAVDPTLPEAVRDEFMVDLLNRPNSIRVPLFLELARNPDHPDNENAYDTLEIFTNQKLGADWAGWEKAVDAWLKENPDTVGKKTPPSEPVEQ